MIRIELPEQMLAVIMQVLGTQPHDRVRPIVDELMRQINLQRSPGLREVDKATS